MKLVELFSQRELDSVEDKLDAVFDKFDIDVVFSRHFIERLNDKRNASEITPEELEKIYTEVSRRYGNKLSKENPSYQALMQDLSTALNIPIVMSQHPGSNSGKKKMVAKTIMKKPGFVSHSAEDVLQVGLNTKRK